MLQGGVLHRNDGTIVVNGSLSVIGGTTVLENSGRIEVTLEWAQIWGSGTLLNVCNDDDKGIVHVADGAVFDYSVGTYDDSTICLATTFDIPCAADGVSELDTDETTSFQMTCDAGVQTASAVASLGNSDVDENPFELSLSCAVKPDDSSQAGRPDVVTPAPLPSVENQ